jgi:hypothetical protein
MLAEICQVRWKGFPELMLLIKIESMKNVVKYIDEVIEAVKEKGDEDGFNYCDARVILSFEIARLEICTQGALSDLSIRALTEIKSMDARQNYLNIYPDVFDKISLFMLKVQSLEPRFVKDPPGIIGFSIPSWHDYFVAIIGSLFSNIHK